MIAAMMLSDKEVRAAGPPGCVSPRIPERKSQLEVRNPHLRLGGGTYMGSVCTTKVAPSRRSRSNNFIQGLHHASSQQSHRLGIPQVAPSPVEVGYPVCLEHVMNERGA